MTPICERPGCTRYCAIDPEVGDYYRWCRRCLRDKRQELEDSGYLEPRVFGPDPERLMRYDYSQCRALWCSSGSPHAPAQFLHREP